MGVIKYVLDEEGNLYGVIQWGFLLFFIVFWVVMLYYGGKNPEFVNALENHSPTTPIIMGLLLGIIGVALLFTGKKNTEVEKE